MRKIPEYLATSGKGTKNTQSKKGKMFGKLLIVKVCMIGLDLNLQMKKVNYKLRARHQVEVVKIQLIKDNS